MNLYKVLCIDSRDVVMMEQLLGLDGVDNSVIEGYIYEDKLKGQKLKDKIFHYCMDILVKQFIEDMIRFAYDENNHRLESALRDTYYELKSGEELPCLSIKIKDKYIDGNIVMIYYLNGYEEEAYQKLTEQTYERN